MIDPFELVNTFEKALIKEPLAHVYSKRRPYGGMLIKWNNNERVLIQAWNTDNPIGHKRVYEKIKKTNYFKGRKVDVWVFIVHNLRQNSYRLLNEYNVVLLELSKLGNTAMLLGAQNIPSKLLPVLIGEMEAEGVSTSYDFDGLVTATDNFEKQYIKPVATKTQKRTAFISYSWDSDEHIHWVLKIAADLLRNGINVLIDEWDLSDHGNDLHHFMEEGIREADFVIIVCTPNYAERANSRSGGVGVESSIITGEYYNTKYVQKYIPLIRKETNELSDCLPSYLKGKLAIIFSDNQSYESSFESLLRRIADKPRFKKPKLGEFPELSSNEI